MKNTVGFLLFCLCLPFALLSRYAAATALLAGFGAALLIAFPFLLLEWLLSGLKAPVRRWFEGHADPKGRAFLFAPGSVFGDWLECRAFRKTVNKGL